MYATSCQGKNKRVPPKPPDHFSSDSDGDKTGSMVLMVLIIYRKKNTTKDGWTREAATAMNDIGVRKIKCYVAI